MPPSENVLDPDRDPVGCPRSPADRPRAALPEHVREPRPALDGRGRRARADRANAAAGPPSAAWSPLARRASCRTRWSNPWSAGAALTSSAPPSVAGWTRRRGPRRSRAATPLPRPRSPPARRWNCLPRRRCSSRWPPRSPTRGCTLGCITARMCGPARDRHRDGGARQGAVAGQALGPGVDGRRRGARTARWRRADRRGQQQVGELGRSRGLHRYGVAGREGRRMGPGHGPGRSHR